MFNAVGKPYVTLLYDQFMTENHNFILFSLSLVITFMFSFQISFILHKYFIKNIDIH